jgi:hypothetical protein
MDTRRCIVKQLHVNANITWRFCDFKEIYLSHQVRPYSAVSSVQDVLPGAIFWFMRIFKIFQPFFFPYIIL